MLRDRDYHRVTCRLRDGAGGRYAWERLRRRVKASVVRVGAPGGVALHPLRSRAAHVVQLRTIAVQQVVDKSMDRDEDVHPRTPLLMRPMNAFLVPTFGHR